MTCPNCGKPLTTIADGGETAPFKCTPCRRGWWNAELTTAARAKWRKEFQDFGTDGVIADAAHAEMVAQVGG